jgi:Fe-S-cluster containining protein
MNTMMSISLDTIGEMLQHTENWQQALEAAYALLPATRCRRKIHCCSMLPEMTWIEAAFAIYKIVGMRPSLRLRLIKKMTRYFLANAVEITACPFLDKRDCLIYQDRFFGCRAYGLWSMNCYGQLTARNQLTKKQLQGQWKRLGIRLPQHVIDFKVPYCLDVEIADNITVDDNFMIHVSHEIESLSGQFPEAHHAFRQGYFSDLSFLVAAMMFGMTESVKMKFNAVKEFVIDDDREKLNTIINECSDLFAGLAIKNKRMEKAR